MKQAATKNNTAKLSKNQRIGKWQEVKYNKRQKAFEVSKNRKRSNRIKPLYKFSTIVG